MARKVPLGTPVETEYQAAVIELEDNSAPLMLLLVTFLGDQAEAERQRWWDTRKGLGGERVHVPAKVQTLLRNRGIEARGWGGSLCLIGKLEEGVAPALLQTRTYMALDRELKTGRPIKIVGLSAEEAEKRKGKGQAVLPEVELGFSLEPEVQRAFFAADRAGGKLLVILRVKEDDSLALMVAETRFDWEPVELVIEGIPHKKKTGKPQGLGRKNE